MLHSCDLLANKPLYIIDSWGRDVQPFLLMFVVPLRDDFFQEAECKSMFPSVTHYLGFVNYVNSD